MKISIITPFFNERQNLPLFRKRVSEVLATLDVDHELILIDDHSNDDGDLLVSHWAESDHRIKYIRLARNCGSHSACTAGLAESDGDCAILLAADLQDPPETIPLLLEKWRSGFDVVWAARAEREGEKMSTKVLSRIYYLAMRKLALPDMPDKGADFLLIDRRVVQVYNSIPEKNTSFLALILWIGFRQTSIQYTKEARAEGKSKWTLSKKIKLFIDSMVSFSYFPIRAMSVTGVFMAFLGFVYAFYILISRLSGNVTAGTGFAAIMIVLLIGQGMIMSMLGILGEYLWRTFDEARGRPRYIIETARNCSNENKSDRPLLLTNERLR